MVFGRLTLLRSHLFKKNMRSFTLIELIIISVVIGILAAFAMPAYFNAKQRALDREAQANLNLISAAEKVQRLQSGIYISYNNLRAINTGLDLSIPVPSIQPWEYKVVAVPAAGANPARFTAAARRSSDHARIWCITNTSDEPYDENGITASGGNGGVNCTWP